jgi:hypothetical protein
LDNFKDFKVIIIEPNSTINNQCQIGHIIQNQEYTFNDLTEETQNQLSETRNVIFQGKQVLLKSLIQKESFSFLNSEHLEKLIRNESVLEISKKDETNFEELSKYYIPRQLKRFIQFERKILESDTEKQFKITESLEDFIKLCKENSN